MEHYTLPLSIYKQRVEAQKAEEEQQVAALAEASETGGDTAVNSGVQRGVDSQSLSAGQDVM